MESSDGEERRARKFFTDPADEKAASSSPAGGREGGRGGLLFPADLGRSRINDALTAFPLARTEIPRRMPAR